MLAPWLLTAIVKIVTTYTIPGQRVLLVAPADLTDPTGPRHTGTPRPSNPGPYSGLTEAAWTVLRLGRGVHTQLTPPTQHPVDDPNLRSGWTHLPDPGAQSESGPGPHFEPTPGPGAASPDRLSARSTEPGPTPIEQYDLIITAADPDTIGWLRPADWTTILTPTGTLAIVTNSYHQQGRVVDPAAALIPPANRGGLVLLDRIIVLALPAPEPAGTPPTPNQHSTETDLGPASPGSGGQADLFVLTPQPETMTSTGKQGDLR